ncbi:MAG: Bax inhibitor-1/YccA family protein [Flavobacteriales bacterium]|nr:Bax inhibitor-1/YccA family protein [Flavobacteriales bacterium]
MSDYLNSQRDTVLDFTGESTSLRKFFTQVFTYMTVGLAISGLVAWFFATSGLISVLFNQTGGLSLFGYIVVFSPVLFTMFFGRAIQKLSTPALSAVFIGYSIVLGMSISFIFLAYTTTSIFQVFLMTAITFAAFAVLGFTTKTDLTKLGMILGIGFFVMVIISILNFLIFKSEMASLVMSYIGVILTIGLIAYHVQQLKRIGSGAEYGNMETTKLALIGAFTMYISFINLFMFLLRIFGRRE